MTLLGEYPNGRLASKRTRRSCVGNASMATTCAETGGGAECPRMQPPFLRSMFQRETSLAHVAFRSTRAQV